MIKTIMLSGGAFEKDKEFYFRNVDEVINKFLNEHNAEYVDVKVLDPENYTVLLIYKEMYAKEEL